MSALVRLGAEIAGCRACPRLVAWRETVAQEKRAAFRDEEYWGRAVSGFGDESAHIAVLGRLPGSNQYRNVERNPQVEIEPDIAVVRMDASLFLSLIHI